MKTFTGIEYIKIAVANAYGLDKLTWKNRLDWFEAQKNLYTLIPKAEEPYQFIAAVSAYEDAINGVPTGYVMGLDACSSGIQLMALCSGDLTAAEQCGLIASDGRKDIHKAVGDVLKNEYSRGDMKKCTMQVMYGSKTAPDMFIRPDDLDDYYKALECYMPECCGLLNTMLASHHPKATEYVWELPDGHIANVPVMDTSTYKIKLPELEGETFTHRVSENVGKKYDVSLAANIIQSIDGYVARELVMRSNYDSTMLHNAIRIIRKFIIMDKPLKTNKAISITRAYDLSYKTIINYTNEELYNLYVLCNELLKGDSFKVLSVHDKFFCSPNYMNQLRQHVINIYSDLAKSNLMHDIIDSVTEGRINYQKKETNLSELIKNSEYIIS